MSTPEQLGSLNAPQRRAVTYGEPLPGGKGFRAGPLLIVAGAGTGKTNTLAHRVAHLAMSGVDPARILMLTFTRRAALEMKRRANEIMREAFNDKLGSKASAISQRLTWAGTFHSVGNRPSAERGEDVVRLPPGIGDDRNVVGLQQFEDHPDLRPELIGHLLAVGLVLRIDFEPFPGLGRLHREEEMRRLLLLEEMLDVPGEAEHGICRLPPRPGHRLPDGEEDLEEEGKGVDDVESVGHGKRR